MQVANWFMSGGIFMYAVLMADILAIIVGIVLLATFEKNNFRVYFIIILFLGLLPVLLGGAGFMIGDIQIQSAIVNANPADRQELYDASMAIAKQPLYFGGISSAFILLFGLVGLTLRRV